MSSEKLEIHPALNRVISHGNEVKSQQLEKMWGIVKSNTDLNGIVDLTVSTRGGYNLKTCINYFVDCYDKIHKKGNLRKLRRGLI